MHGQKNIKFTVSTLSMHLIHPKFVPQKTLPKEMCKTQAVIIFGLLNM